MPNALIAEHHLPIRKVMRLHLAASGFDVVECADGMSALRFLRRQPFDLIVLDVMLPGLDGLSVCRMVRSGRTNADSPILMVTDRGIGPRVRHPRIHGQNGRAHPSMHSRAGS